MIPDDASDYCMRCKKVRFTAINRRHHCRYCGYIVCGKCGKNQLASRRDLTKVAKIVCTPCFEKYKDIYPKPKSGATAEEESDDSEDESGNKTSSKSTASTISKLRTSVISKVSKK